MSAASNAQHSTASNEHYTPPEIVEPARECMRGIDLDPASCALANTVVQAARIFTIDDDGFSQPWGGKVFLNPPGGLCDVVGRKVIRKTASHGDGCTVTGACGLPPGHIHEGVTSSAKAWWFKLAQEWAAGRVEAAVFVGFTVEILQSTQVETPADKEENDGSLLPIPLDFPLFFPSQRIKYLKQDVNGLLVPGSQPTHANVIILLPGDDLMRHRFKQCYSTNGIVRL